MGDEFQAWKQHFLQQAQGLIPHQKKFYNVSEQTGRGDGANIKLVSPTQQVVERAKSTLSQVHDTQPPNTFDPVTGVMLPSPKKHNKIRFAHKRKKKTQSKKRTKKQKISKKSKKLQKVKNKLKNKKKKNKKKVKQNNWWK